MAKIDELTALLIDEISTFEKVVADLKKESKNIQEHQIKINTSEVETIFKNFESKLNINYQLENNQLKVIQNKLNKTAIIPNWMAILFSVFFIVLIFSIGCNYYQYQKTEKKISNAYIIGKKEVENHIFNFFDKHPKSYTYYQKWSKKSTK